MMARLFRVVAWWVLAVSMVSTPVYGQTVEADRFRYVSGGCVWSSGAGSPESAVTGNPCDWYVQTDSPYTLWRKTSGTGNTGWVAVTSGTGGLTPAALTKTDDTNVTLTLGGSPTTALLNAASLTLGWSGQLSLARGGTNANLTAVNGGIVYGTASAMAISAAGSSGQVLQSNGASAPTWSTATYPTTVTANRVMFGTSANVFGTSANLTFDGTYLRVPSGAMHANATGGFSLGTSGSTYQSGGFYHTTGTTDGASYFFSTLGGFRIDVEGKANAITIAKTSGATVVAGSFVGNSTGRFDSTATVGKGSGVTGTNTRFEVYNTSDSFLRISAYNSNAMPGLIFAQVLNDRGWAFTFSDSTGAFNLVRSTSGIYPAGSLTTAFTMSSAMVATYFGNNLTLSPASADAVISAIGVSAGHGSLFLSGQGSGKDTHIVYGNGKTLDISYSASATATATGTMAMRFGASGAITAAGNMTVGGTFGVTGTTTLTGTLALPSGHVTSWSSGDVTLTHSANALAFAGASSGYSFDAATSITGIVTVNAGYLRINESDSSTIAGWVNSDADEGYLELFANGVSSTFIRGNGASSFASSIQPKTNDVGSLGVSGTAWSDLFLASGAVINLATNDVTMTHSSNALAFAGASSGYSFDAVVAANGGITVDSTAFTVADSTGNTTIAGTLGVTGTTTLGTLALSNVASHLVPSVTDTYDFGSASRLWRSGYVSTLNAVVFAETTQTLYGGYSTIGHDAGSVDADVSAAATTINFGDTMTPGDFVLIRAHDTGNVIKAEYITVGSLVSGTTYNVTRDVAGSHGTDPAWAAGTPYLVLGQSGDGRIDLIAVDGKPRIVFTQQGATYNAQTDHAVLGNLNTYYGYATDVWGAGFGAASGTNLLVDATNGVRFRNSTSVLGQLTGTTWTLGSTSTEHVAITSTAINLNDGATTWTSIGAGAVTVGQVASGQSNVYITGGAVELRNNTTTRVRLSSDGSGYLANSSIAWDTSGNLVMTGNATIGGWSVTTTAITATSGTVGMSSADVGAGDIRFWAGDSTPSFAEFRVTEDGALTATNATITGAITATSGSFSGSVTSTSGTIGGWTLASTTLTGGNLVLTNTGNLSAGTSNDIARISADDATYRLWIGHATASSAPFRVTKAGAVTMTSATVTGAITATSGSVGSFTIGTYLYTGSKTAWNDTNSGVHIGSDGIGVGNNVFTINGSTGAMTATSATITSASGSITLDSNGITSTIGTSGISSLSAYRFTPGTEAGSTFGVYGFEPGGGLTQRWIDVANIGTANTTVITQMRSDNSVAGVAYVYALACESSPSGGSDVLPGTATTCTANTSHGGITADRISLTGEVFVSSTLNTSTVSTTGTITATSTVRSNSGFNINGTAGHTATCNPTAGNITVSGGLVTGCTSADAATDRVAILEAEVRELRRLLYAVLSGSAGAKESRR
jgi:hypothetical protein